MFLERFIESDLEKLLDFMPVVLLRGARQTGKTTLVETFKEKGYAYLSLDDPRNLLYAKQDPIGFVRDLSVKSIIDEVQRCPEIFLSIKVSVDQNRLPGRFLLTGSADPLLVPNMGDSLAGRMSLLNLYPLSEGEKRRVKNRWVDSLWDGSFEGLSAGIVTRDSSLSSWLAGGYPSLVHTTAEKKQWWLEAYTELILQKDVSQLAQVDHLIEIPRLLTLLADRVGCLVNFEEVGRSLRLSGITVKRYLSLLQALFLYQPLPAWHFNLAKRLIKTPKIYLNDVALVTYLLGLSNQKIKEDGPQFGRLLENFVFNELQKGQSWSSVSFGLFHLRGVSGEEVDFILEKRGGEVIAIEVKAREMVSPDDFKVIKGIQKEMGDKFVRGFVVYMGDKIVRYGENLYALPLSCLWG